MALMSRLPNQDDAARLWDDVVGLAGFPGFAELKRSLRERAQLASFGVETDSRPLPRHRRRRVGHRRLGRLVQQQEAAK